MWTRYSDDKSIHLSVCPISILCLNERTCRHTFSWSGRGIFLLFDCLPPSNTDHGCAPRQNLHFPNHARNTRHPYNLESWTVYITDPSLQQQYTVTVKIGYWPNRISAKKSEDDGRHMSFEILRLKSRSYNRPNNRSENACKIFNKRAQIDKEKYYLDIADEAEAQFVHNDLRFAYRAIRHIRRPFTNNRRIFQSTILKERFALKTTATYCPDRQSTTIRLLSHPSADTVRNWRTFVHLPSRIQL